MSPIPSKSIRSGSPRRFPAALAASLSRACPRLLAFAALCLFALPGVSRADSVGGMTVIGTEAWTSTSGGTGDGLRTVTGQMTVGWGGSGPGTLNQTAGTIDTSGASWGTIIAQGGGASGSTWNMSGSAIYLGNGTTGGNSGILLGNSAHATWTLTDSASASVTGLIFSNGGNGYANHLLLSGAATFSATSLTGLTGANQYISFATGSTATFTAGNKTLSDYQALVAAGNIRVDEVKQTDFSKFQVVGHTLSLSTGGSTPPHLVITSVSPASPTAGSTFSVTVEAQDESNTATNLTDATLVTLTRKTGNGTLGGIVSDTIAANSSSVTISGVTYTKAESGVVLTPDGGGLAALDSAPITVVPGAPAKLAFGVQPSTTSPGAAISPAVTVLVQDAEGNTVPGDTRSVTVGSTCTFSSGSDLNNDAVDGVATFDLIEPTTEGTYTLTASADSLTGAESNPFTVGADTVGGWTIIGTVNRSAGRTVTGQMTVGWGGTGPGTLNQTGGTINTSGASWGTIIAQGGGASGSAWNMSGNAIYLGNGTTGGNSGILLGNEADATWTLTDSASATVSGLIFSNGGNGYANHLLLSGAATFSATSLVGLTGANQYISFATGSTATFTAGNMTLSDYQALVAAGNIRVDGVVQTDFSKFQVTGNTLSLGSGGTSPYASWAGGHAFDSLNSEGVPYGMAWLLGAATNASSSIGLPPTVTGASGGFLTVHFTRVLDPGATAKLYLEYSDDLTSGSWTSVEVPAATGPVSGVEFTVGTSGGLYDITAQIPMDSSAKRFARLVATE
ncbi:MAG: hypothetical protein NTW21_03230 [Verrucomicrobia bacterium]|nr:hypothetical protein [Verrucomicrobiota bacterium]